MARTLIINDETAVGKVLHQVLIDVQQETLTVAELIRLRVECEVADYNRRLPDFFNGLVQPNEAERVLNGYRLLTKRTIDPEKQLYIALDAFTKNGFFVLVDNRQAELLDEEILLTDSTTVSFIKLTPLVGG